MKNKCDLKVLYNNDYYKLRNVKSNFVEIKRLIEDSFMIKSPIIKFIMKF